MKTHTRDGWPIRRTYAGEVNRAIGRPRITRNFEVIPHGCHVYLLWGNDPKRPLYVGKSRNILSRLGSHMSDPSKLVAVTSVQVLQCDSRAAMDALETAMISLHQPPWNVVGRQDGHPDDL